MADMPTEALYRNGGFNDAKVNARPAGFEKAQ